ncbi:MAG: tRNA (guanosine(37)-N1)-methyltransferase TrmD [Planctomycetota bacterium]
MLGIVPRIDVISLFPEALQGYLDASIVGRARRRGLIDVELVDPRRWAGGRHRKVDDRPFGGGPGMVLSAAPLAEAIEACLSRSAKPRLLLTDPRGRKLDQPWVDDLAETPHLVVVCGHYEGIDERIIELFKPELVSVGDLVISGGELAALVLIDAVTRLQPGALGDAQSAAQDSFADGKGLDHPCYTRPEDFRDLRVPEALLSGDHAAIERWRKAESERRTRERQRQP